LSSKSTADKHATDPRDKARDRWLREHHYRVLRFWNNDVLANMDGVLETIALELAATLPPDSSMGS
jgi:very-short-patch-repair endonuclease